MESRLQTRLYREDLGGYSENVMQSLSLVLIPVIPRGFLIIVGLLRSWLIGKECLSRLIILMIIVLYHLFLHMASKMIHHLSHLCLWIYPMLLLSLFYHTTKSLLNPWKCSKLFAKPETYLYSLPAFLNDEITQNVLLGFVLGRDVLLSSKCMAGSNRVRMERKAG